MSRSGRRLCRSNPHRRQPSVSHPMGAPLRWPPPRHRRAVPAPGSPKTAVGAGHSPPAPRLLIHPRRQGPDPLWERCPVAPRRYCPPPHRPGPRRHCPTPAMPVMPSTWRPRHPGTIPDSPTLPTARQATPATTNATPPQLTDPRPTAPPTTPQTTTATPAPLTSPTAQPPPHAAHRSRPPRQPHHTQPQTHPPATKHAPQTPSHTPPIVTIAATPELQQTNITHGLRRTVGMNRTGFQRGGKSTRRRVEG